MVSQRGVTLVELVIALGLSTLLLGAIYSVYLTHDRMQLVQEDVVTMQQDVRAAMDVMGRELRMAGYDPRGVNTDDDPHNDFVGLVADGSRLEIRADLNGNGALTESHEVIQYLYDAETKTLRRKTGKGGRQPFVEPIESFELQFFDQHGQPTVISAEIREIEWVVTARTVHVDASYSLNNGYRMFTLRSRVAPRNLGLPLRKP